MGCANSTCKNCNETCNTEQSLCTISSEQATSYGGSFSWPTAPSGNTIVKVWTVDAWNTLKAMLDAVYAAGALCSSQGESWGSNPMPTISPDQILTADIFNAAAEAINNIIGSPTVPSVTPGGIDGTIFRDYHAIFMQSHYNSGKIYRWACDECNTECDAECDTCIGCVNCQGMLHYSTCYSNCYSS